MYVKYKENRNTAYYLQIFYLSKTIKIWDLLSVINNKYSNTDTQKRETLSN